MNISKHKPLMKRPRCLTLEEALGKFGEGENVKKRKITQNGDTV